MEHLDLCDPYRDAFLKAAGSNDAAAAVISTDEQWRFFRKALEKGGLLSQDDADLLDDMWAEVVKDGMLFQAKDKPRIKLTFQKWQKMLSKRVPPDMTPAIQSVETFHYKAGIYDEMVSDWNPHKMDRDQMQKLLFVIGTLQERHQLVRQKLVKCADESAYAVVLEQTWQLLGEGGLDKLVENRANGAVNYPPAWQFNHIEAIERISRQRRPRKLRFLPTRKSGPRGHPLQDDVYGLAQGYNGRHEICIYRATSQSKEGEGQDKELMVVAVPSSAPHTATTAQLNAHLAHRELGLATGVVHSLGKDWSSRYESLYYYEAAAGVTLKELLMPERGPRVILREDGLLFQYWVGRILRALAELQEQSTYTLLNPTFGLENVVVGGRGLNLRLGNVRWGPQTSPFIAEAEEMLRNRMRMLLRSFAAVIQEMLGLNGHSCWHGWYSNIGRVISTKSVEHIGHYKALQGLKIQEGDEVVLDLDSHLRCYTDFRVEMDSGERGGGTGGDAAVVLDWEKEQRPGELNEDVRSIRAWGNSPGRGQILCYYEELEGGRPEGSPMVIPFEVIAVSLSPRLKAVLRTCQLAGGSGPAFEGTAKQFLDEGGWRDKVSRVWLQDLVQNEYFTELGDGELDQVLCEYEELMEKKGGSIRPPE